MRWIDSIWFFRFPCVVALCSHWSQGYFLMNWFIMSLHICLSRKFVATFITRVLDFSIHCFNVCFQASLFCSFLFTLTYTYSILFNSFNMFLETTWDIFPFLVPLYIHIDYKDTFIPNLNSPESLWRNLLEWYEVLFLCKSSKNTKFQIFPNSMLIIRFIFSLAPNVKKIISHCLTWLFI